MPYSEAAGVARMVSRPAQPRPARCVALTKRPSLAEHPARMPLSLSATVTWAWQLGFQVGADFVSEFGKEDEIDEHQFAACLSVCHGDQKKYPKGKQASLAPHPPSRTHWTDVL